MSRTGTKSPSKTASVEQNGVSADVLTLAEAANYLRVKPEDVLRMVEEQDLPARRIGSEWRFFRGAVQQWLSQCSSPGKRAGIWAAAGSWQDDPYLDELLREINRSRGRSDEGR